MRITKKVNRYFNMIENIKYDNEHGGDYAYIQYMAYSRELIKLLRNTGKVERQLELIEATNWLFNECLTTRFSHTNKIVFDDKMRQTKEIFNLIKFKLNKTETNSLYERTTTHIQAA